MRLDQLFLKEDETTVKTMSMPEKVSAFDRLQPGQEIGLWFDSVIRRADKYKPFVVGRKTRSKLRPIEKITLLQKSKDGGTGGMKYYLYKRNGDNVSLAMGDMAASLVDIKEAKAYDINEADATIMERIVLDIDYSRNPEALLKAVHAMGRRLDLTLMNAPQAIKDLKEKGFARIEGKDADIMSFVNYLYSKGIEPTYDIQNMDKVQTPGLNANPNMPAFIGKKKEPAKDESVQEGHSNTRHQAQTMLKLEELRDMIMVLDMDDDSKTSALTALDQVADDITILESKDGANTSDGKHQEKICRDTVKNPNKSMLGGPSPEEAEKTLKSKFGYSDDKISKLKEEVIGEENNTARLKRELDFDPDKVRSFINNLAKKQKTSALSDKEKQDFADAQELLADLSADLDEAKATAGPDKCWPGYKKVGTKPGTGKNKGKTVNDCKKA